MNFNYYVEKQIPFVDGGRSIDGADCWGLAYLFYKNELGIDLPKYENFSVGDNTKETIQKIENEKMTKWQETKTPVNGNMVLLRMKNRSSHVGIYKEHNKMLHLEDGSMAIIEPLDGLKWKNRVIGFFHIK